MATGNNMIVSKKTIARVLSLSLGSLSKDIFRRRMSTLSVVVVVVVVATKSVLLSFFTHIQTICPKKRPRSLPKKAKRPLPADARASFKNGLA